VSCEPAASTRLRPRGIPESAWAAVALPACLLVALAVFSHGLGASSLFIDESASWHAAAGSLGDVFARVRADEVAPSTFYVLLHEWIFRFHDSSETWMRLPSMLAGVALVGAVAWLAYLVSGRAAACLAALLAALDPAILNYAQQVRAYAFAMLAVTIAVAAVLTAERNRERRRVGWFALGLAAAVAGYSLHYTAALVLLPLTIYVLRSRALSRRLRAAWLAVVSLTILAWLPLLLSQLGAGHNGWLGSTELHWGADLGQTFGAALAGRAPETPTRLLIGAAIVCAAVAIAVLRSPGMPTKLVAACAITPPVALLVVTVSGQPAMLNRYVAVGVPFMVVCLATAAVAVSRVARGSVAAVLVVAWLVLAGLGVRASYETIGHYADMRGVVRVVRSKIRPGDVLVGVGNQAILFSMEYYATQLLSRGTPVMLASDPRAGAAVRARRTIWAVSPPVSSRQVNASLASEQYLAAGSWIFPAMQALELVESRPAPAR
jgi:4-amino-4-deoxy-L-arabinose transferase-like glycosyltransferase